MATTQPKKRETEKSTLWLRYYLGEANLNANKAARWAGYANPAVEGSRQKKRQAAAIKHALAAANMPTEEILRRMADYAKASFAPFIYPGDDEGPIPVERIEPPEVTKARKTLVDAALFRNKPPENISQPDRLSWSDPSPEEIAEANKILESFIAEDGEGDELNFNLHSRQARANIHFIREVKVTRNSLTVEKKNGDKTTQSTLTMAFKLHDAKDALKWLGEAAGLRRDQGADLGKIDLSKLSTRQLQRLQKGEDLLKILLTPDGNDAEDVEEQGEVEDDLPDNNATNAHD